MAGERDGSVSPVGQINNLASKTGNVGVVMAKFSVILLAAGRSSRFGDKEKKPFANLDGRAVWLRSAELFITRTDVCQTMVVISPEDVEAFRRKFAPNLAFMNVQMVEGGNERFDSV